MIFISSILDYKTFPLVGIYARFSGIAWVFRGLHGVILLLLTIEVTLAQRNPWARYPLRLPNMAGFVASVILNHYDITIGEGDVKKRNRAFLLRLTSYLPSSIGYLMSLACRSWSTNNGQLN